jgi:PAS domain S-box-containing protein
MLEDEQHRLLKRQLKKVGLDILDNPKYADFLSLVNEAYKSFDKDVKHIEHILEESSKELFSANQRLTFERDKTRNKLENIVDNVVGVIFETDLEGNYTFLNNAWEKYSGIPLDQAIGRNFRDFLYEDKIDGNKDFKQVFVAEKRYIKFVFQNTLDGKSMWFEVKARLINDEQGNPEKYIGTIIDITNLKETEIQLKNVNKELAYQNNEKEKRADELSIANIELAFQNEEKGKRTDELKKASEAKETFLSTMSHEIRTPLNAVTGLANILLMEDYLPTQEENLKALKYSGEHLLGLINDLLDFNKINSGIINVIEKEFSLNFFLENITSHFTIRTREKGVVFNLIKENNVPNIIIGDKLKLAQIINNLLSNSLKFTKKGSISLKVKNLGINENKVKLQFNVVDTGIGILKSKQGTIFESFMQADSETSIKYGGSGLGLAISKKLLNLQNSDFSVKSEPGKGAEFSFIIEYKVSNNLNVYEPELIKMQPDYEPLNMRVIVAEDNKMNVLILKRFFEKWKVSYEIALNGNEVLKILDKTKESFDLILMDLQMPELNGYEAAKIIRNMPNTKIANIPIIALTAFAQTDIKEKTEQYKMNGFMGKPFNPVELYALLKSYCKAHIISSAS